jgi:hypothetical protein
MALLERRQWSGPMPVTPLAITHGSGFQIHDHQARQIEVFGSWDDWRAADGHGGINSQFSWPLRR